LNLLLWLGQCCSNNVQQKQKIAPFLGGGGKKIYPSTADFLTVFEFFFRSNVCSMIVHFHPQENDDHCFRVDWFLFLP
jgi:hypothetical protein